MPIDAVFSVGASGRLRRSLLPKGAAEAFLVFPLSSMLLTLQESDTNVVSVSSLTCTEECRIHVKW